MRFNLGVLALAVALPLAAFLVAAKSATVEVQADAGTEETRQFVRRVRRVTRRKFTSEEKVRIVLEGFRREIGVSELCGRS